MRFLLVLLIAVGAMAAVAMHITKDVSLLAWSSDGLSALLSYDADGPEGGGSSGFGVLTCMGEGARVTVSSDFSNGGSSHPQTITEKSCRDGLTKRDETLKANAFKGITVTPDGCKARTGMVISTATAMPFSSKSIDKPLFRVPSFLNLSRSSTPSEVQTTCALGWSPPPRDPSPSGFGSG